MDHDHDDDVMYCYRHPDVEATLRCYQCERPICARCARRTPVGYICPQCSKGHRKRFETARITDYVIAAVVSLVMGGISSLVPIIVPLYGWFMYLISPLAGTLTAEAVWRLVGRRYSRHLWWIVVAGLVLGNLPLMLLMALGGIGTFMSGNAFGLYSVFFAIVHVVLAASAAIAILRLR
jgi:hypothetical protein